MLPIRSCMPGTKWRSTRFGLKFPTMGFVSDEDRPLELEQIQTGKNDAKADVHCVAFTNEELKAKY